MAVTSIVTFGAHHGNRDRFVLTYHSRTIHLPSIQSMTFTTLIPPKFPRLNLSIVSTVFGKLSLMASREPNSLFFVYSERMVITT